MSAALPHPLPGKRILIVMPAWNEQEALPAILNEVSCVLPWADVLVVNDGSTDATATTVRRSDTARLLDLPLNLGVGGAMRAGYKYAHRSGYDVAVQLDSDGQHDPAEVPRLVEALFAQGADVVIGARFAGRGEYTIRGPRRWAMRLLSAVLSRVCHTELTDTTSGFKAAGRRAISLFAREYPAEYLGDTIESLVIAARADMKVVQIPVAMRKRSGGTPSHNPLKSALFLGRATLAMLVALTRPHRSSLPEIELAQEVAP